MTTSEVNVPLLQIAPTQVKVRDTEPMPLGALR
jgi:hypothetical protein